MKFPPAQRVIQAALRQDSAAGCQAEAQASCACFPSPANERGPTLIVKSSRRAPKVKWSGQQDSNLRPSAPKADALPGCAMPRPGAQGADSGYTLRAGPARKQGAIARRPSLALISRRRRSGKKPCPPARCRASWRSRRSPQAPPARARRTAPDAPRAAPCSRRCARSARPCG